MYYLESDNINFAYKEIVKHVFFHGKLLKKSNGVSLIEVVPAIIKLSNPKYSIITHKGRPYNVAFMIAETLWNLCGEISPWLCNYNKQYYQYYTNDELIAGYGNRIFNRFNNQFLKVAEMLKNDRDTSHATISVFDPKEDLEDSKFVPCISFLEFRVINSRLNMFVRMRAQDLWKGFPYDINLLINLFLLMSNLTDIEMGDYYHDCRSIRLYEEDMENISKFLKLDNDYQYANPEKIELPYGKDYLKQLLRYKDIVKGDVELKNSDIKNIPSYWKNGLLACEVYKLVINRNFEKAFFYMNKIDNAFKTQIIIWSKQYYPSFYNYIREI